MPSIPKLRVPLSMLGGGPTRVNLLPNPSGELDIANFALKALNWTETIPLTRGKTALAGKDGEYWIGFSLKKDNTVTLRTFNLVTGTANGAITPGLPYSLQILIRADDNAALGTGAYLNWFHDGELVEAALGILPNVTGATIPVQVFKIENVIAPEGANRCEVVLKGESTTKEDVATILTDSWMLEQSETCGDFFPTVEQLASGRAEFSAGPYNSPSFLMPPSGKFPTIEQDTPEDIAQCVEAAARTLVGSRLEAPEYGIPDETFKQLGPNESAEVYVSAIEAMEPRAHLLGTAEIVNIIKRVTLVLS